MLSGPTAPHGVVDLLEPSVDLGVSLGWAYAPSAVVPERQNHSLEPLIYGEPLALEVDGRWLKHSTMAFGVYLDFSDTPVYEWYALGGTPGTSIDSLYTSTALWNKDAKDFLICGHQMWGVYLTWYQKSLPPTPPPPPTNSGVKTMVVTNCITERRPLEIYALDHTAGGDYEGKGSVASQYTADGHCGPDVGTNSVYDLKAGHVYDFLAIDYTAPGCTKDPHMGCERWTGNGYVGDANGIVYPYRLG